MFLHGKLALCLSISLVCFGCSSGSSSSPSPSAAAAGSGGGSDKKVETTNSDDPQLKGGPYAGKKFEDLSIVQSMIAKQTSVADTFLAQADQLEYRALEKGTEISFEQCQAINSKISTNYKLVTHEIIGKNGYETHQGTNVCSNTDMFQSNNFGGGGTHYYLSHVQVKNMFGVRGSSVLTIVYQSMADEFLVHTMQYVLDSKSKIIEVTLHVDNVKDGITYNDLAALSPEGHVLGLVEKNRPNMNEEYLWKRASTFVSADGTSGWAMRVYQNDGKGTPIVKSSYTVADLTWEAYEATPLYRLGGLYKIGGKVVDWPQSQISFEVLNKGTDHCGYGYTGYDEHGESIRNFGDILCEKKMDAQTMRR